MTQDIIIQSEPEKKDKNQILEKKFQNLPSFELKILQRIRFWIKNFTTRQIFNENIYNASDFEEKCFLKSMILKKKFLKKHDFVEKFIFNKHDFEESFFKKQILKNF